MPGPLRCRAARGRFDHALDPARHALYSPDEVARGCGPRAAPPDDLIVFHTVFGTSVPDIRLNVIADPGYAVGRWLCPVWPGVGPLRGRGAKGKDLPGGLPNLDDWALIPVCHRSPGLWP
jgi:hypothetical protein